MSSTTTKRKDKKKTDATTSSSSSSTTDTKQTSTSSKDKNASDHSLSSSTSSTPTSITEYSLRYPIFCCASGGKSKLLAVGGGGGASKTGIPNGVALFKWNGTKFTFLAEHTTADCITNLAMHPTADTFAYSIGNKCYVVNFNASNKTFVHFKQFESVSRFQAEVGSPNSSDSGEEEMTHSDTSSKSSAQVKNVPLEQYCCRYSPAGDLLVTSGSDRSIKVWEVPAYTLAHEINNCHTDEVTSLDVNNSNTYMVTTSKDKTCKVWNLLSGRVEQVLHYDIGGQELTFRGCRFLDGGLNLLTCMSRPKSGKVGGCTYVGKWKVASGKLEASQQIHGKMHNTCMELSANQKTLAVGTADSNVTAIKVGTLSRVDRWEPHDFVITGVTFSPDNESVCSVSANYSLKSHKVTPRLIVSESTHPSSSVPHSSNSQPSSV
ncbi:hypothetical protein SAMD00019534_044920 [Acytostelium subglobosum LB1]|uniref:hypothetical protein n=1 Tax=Acytostelium subglobosum LB1 TaxID=1410327 RepID=UPI00064497D7|nr:hypothetical protein SAMD00019534_044920 [Acytostelium subglobosum LB1]GAM21317.1 hypothetical protein SAMD00019534_044920 [Acytostelium subglobosum LB1]|eukprot:XP_012755436.1 hypothetical protein SAMD00019534_044920 [Acytostelium subglobosum LB1]